MILRDAPQRMLQLGIYHPESGQIRNFPRKLGNAHLSHNFFLQRENIFAKEHGSCEGFLSLIRLSFFPSYFPDVSPKWLHGLFRDLFRSGSDLSGDPYGVAQQCYTLTCAAGGSPPNTTLVLYFVHQAGFDVRPVGHIQVVGG